MAGTDRKIEGITGVILVGGKSRRMGRDKAFVEVGGIPLFERVLELFREHFPCLLLVGDRGERFARYGLPVLPDIRSGSALGGIHTALLHAGTDHIFVSSCDLPFPDPHLLRHLCSLRGSGDAVVPLSINGFEPLFALYSRRCLEPVRAQLDSGDCCAYRWFPRVRTRFVGQAEIERLDPSGRCFLNVNTPEELAEAQATASGGATAKAV